MAVSYDLDGDVVLYVPHSGRLFLLNPAASLIWLALEDGSTPEQAARLLAEVARVPLDVARRDCNAVVAQWRAQGFLDDSEHAVGGSARQPDNWWPDSRGVHPAAGTAPTREATYQIVDFRFVLRSDAGDVARSVHEYLAYLAAPGIEPDHALDLTRDAGGWQLTLQGHPIDRCDADDKLVPMMHRTLLVCALRGSRTSVAIHAAALMRDRCNLLLAGDSGVGKSTLTAALLADGFRFCTEDLVLLSDPPGRYRGVATPLRLRENAWPVVEKYWPELRAAPIHRRRGQRRVRYFRPGDRLIVDAPDTYHRADLLVFPRYREGGNLSLEPLGRAETLVMLTDAGYDVADSLSAELVQGLIDWIATIDCYRLEYSGLEDAVGAIRSLSAG